MRSLLIIAVAASLAGCSSLKGTFENRITTTLTGDRAFVASLWAGIGITSELSPEDAAELRLLRQKQQQLQLLQILIQAPSAPAPAASAPSLQRLTF